MRERVLGGELLPGARELGLVYNLKTGGKLKSTPGLVSGGAGVDDMAQLAAVPAKPGVKTATTFLLGEGAADAAGGIDIHGGGRGGDMGLTGGGARGSGLGVRLKRGAGSGGLVAAPAGGVSSGLVELDGDGNCDISLKNRGRGTTAGKFKANNLL